MGENFNISQLPILPVKDLVVFPHIYMPISVGREFSKKAVAKSIDSFSSQIIVTLQTDEENENPAELKDLNKIGVLCKIIKFDPIAKTSNYKLLVQGIKKIELNEIEKNDNILFGTYNIIPNLKYDITNIKNKVLYDTLIKDLVYIIEKGFVSEALIPIKELENPIATCYLLLSITLDSKENQKILESNDAKKVVERTYKEISKQKDFINLKDDIIYQAKESMTKNQKEYFLKEQMKAIRKELGEDGESELDSYEQKLKKIEKFVSKSSYEEIEKNIKKLKNSFAESYEASITRNYLDYVFDLPWDKKSEDNLDIKLAKKTLDEDHFGLFDVKERILEFLSIRKLNPKSKGTIICFYGPPGTGKTSFAKSIARAINRESVRIALGGVKDESEIRGHRKTYVGAMPGKIIQSIRQAGVNNPVFILDEVDKLSSDFRGDPSSALLEVLDPEQNNSFKDHYINLEFDLSKVMFICTANNVETIPPALKDRLEIIKVSGYCEEEKIEIAKKFIIPKTLKESGLDSKEIIFSKDVLKEIIRNYTKEFGVRELERQIARTCRKMVKRKAEEGKVNPVVLKKDILPEYLGADKYSAIEDHKNGVGIVTGLAWTPYGGEILKLEAILIDEKGDTILTGRLGEVMQESAKLAVSLIKNNWKKWEIDKTILVNNRIHLHAPAGAIPKDGPSAGVALVSAMVSLLKNKKIKDSIAMTGEVTLTGKVWPVGGIKEKVLAAIRSNIKLVILPKDNKKDFEEIPELLRGKIKVKYVSDVVEVFKEIF